VSNDRALVATPPISRQTAAALWAVLGVFIFYGSLGAVWTDGPRAAALPGLSLPDISQNVLLYVPFGVLGIWTLQPIPPRTIVSFLRVMAIALVYSAMMEAMQALSAFRISSMLDVAANVAGTVLGLTLAGRAERAMAVAHRAIRSTGMFDASLRLPFAAVVAGAALVAWYPYDLTFDVSTLSERTRLIRADPWLWQGPAELWLQGLYFFTTAALLTACLHSLGTRAALVGAVVTAAIALLIDVGQLAMGRRPIGGAAATAQAAGAAAGAVSALIVIFCRRRREVP
jgi:VanZ family protein